MVERLAAGLTDQDESVKNQLRPLLAFSVQRTRANWFTVGVIGNGAQTCAKYIGSL
jgi:hypothetical protein